MDVYLDYAAATPLDKQVLESMEPLLAEQFYNPSALYQSAVGVKRTLEAARSDVAKLLGLRPAEVIFTAGGTESNNLAILGIARAHPGKHVIYSALEHDSVRKPMEYLASNNWPATEVSPATDGVLKAEDVLMQISDETVLISIMLANNEIGTVQPVKQIAQAVYEIRRQRLKNGNSIPLYIHTDACQAANYMDLNVHRLGVDLITLNGGKIYGPKQSGILGVRVGVHLQPLLYGGGQEFNKRSGTENVAQAVGFAKALEVTTQLRNQESKRLEDLQVWFLAELEKYKKIQINGSRKLRLPNNIHFTVSGIDNERLLFALDDRGVKCATGSACSASKQESSHVLRSIGLTDNEAHSSLRMTFGRQTTKQELMYVLDVLTDLL